MRAPSSPDGASHPEKAMSWDGKEYPFLESPSMTKEDSPRSVCSESEHTLLPTVGNYTREAGVQSKPQSLHNT